MNDSIPTMPITEVKLSVAEYQEMMEDLDRMGQEIASLKAAAQAYLRISWHNPYRDETMRRRYDERQRALEALVSFTSEAGEGE